MTRLECAIQLNKEVKSFHMHVEAYEVILDRLERMSLIKFETERDAAIKEAETHITNQSNDCSRIIKRLLALVK